MNSNPRVLWQGLSFHLGAVLLSLGFITYVEHGKLYFSFTNFKTPMTIKASSRHLIVPTTSTEY